MQCKMQGQITYFTINGNVLSPVTISLYNCAGRIIGKITSVMVNGKPVAAWNNNISSNGVYFYRSLVDGVEVHGKVSLHVQSNILHHCVPQNAGRVGENMIGESIR